MIVKSIVKSESLSDSSVSLSFPTNDKYAMVPEEIQDRSISVTDSISEIIDLVDKLK